MLESGIVSGVGTFTPSVEGFRWHVMSYKPRSNHAKLVVTDFGVRVSVIIKSEGRIRYYLNSNSALKPGVVVTELHTLTESTALVGTSLSLLNHISTRRLKMQSIGDVDIRCQC